MAVCSFLTPNQFHFAKISVIGGKFEKALFSFLVLPLLFCNSQTECRCGGMKGVTVCRVTKFSLCQLLKNSPGVKDLG